MHLYCIIHTYILIKFTAHVWIIYRQGKNNELSSVEVFLYLFLKVSDQFLPYKNYDWTFSIYTFCLKIKNEPNNFIALGTDILKSLNDFAVFCIVLKLVQNRKISLYIFLFRL